MMNAAFRELLQGEVAVVTGAARGNGEAIARGLAQCGAKVIALDLENAAVETAESIRSQGGLASAMKLDVSVAADCQKVAARILETYGPASILINNAGIVRRVEIGEDAFVDSVKKQLEVNTLGSAHMVKALIDQLKQTKGRVVNIGSIASFSATTGGVGYGASKGAVLMLTKAMAVELAPFGIRVNGIAPGLIVTPMTEPTRSNPETARRYLDHIPLNRFGEAQELVGPILFLASTLSSYVTGAMLPVDGGYLAI